MLKRRNGQQHREKRFKKTAVVRFWVKNATRVCASKTNKADLASLAVLEMLVNVGIPWKGGFCLSSKLLPNSVGWRRALVVSVLPRWTFSKMNLDSFLNSDDSFKFVHFNLFFPYTAWWWTRVCVCGGACVSHGLCRRPCMGKALGPVQLPAPPSWRAEQNPFCWNACSTFYICTAAAAS